MTREQMIDGAVKRALARDSLVRRFVYEYGLAPTEDEMFLRAVEREFQNIVEHTA